MMTLRMLGIRRKRDYSPNHVTSDLQIITMTADKLRGLGAAVDMCEEGEEIADAGRYDGIFNMAQGPEGNEKLLPISRAGQLIINSPESVMNCYRTSMTNLLFDNAIPFPRSRIISTRNALNRTFSDFSSGKVWIKRGDVHAVHKEDVILAYTASEKMDIVREFHERGIETAVIQEHIEGDTVKFYGIRESEFFHWYYMNGVYHTPFDQSALYMLAQKSAQTLGVFIFGGDAIIAPNGSITIIDINDWPSFAPVREPASRNIALLLYRKVKDYVRY
jgi:glutathione synthase/RimK-type ligase-like ATP-grasp enzyme